MTSERDNFNQQISENVSLLAAKRDPTTGDHMTEREDVVYMSAAQLAKRYDVDVSTIWRWSQIGKLPRPVRLSSRTTRWRKDQIEECEKRKAG